MYVIVYKNDDGELVLLSLVVYPNEQLALKAIKEKHSYFDRMVAALSPVKLLY